jgi:hypothetical protein
LENQAEQIPHKKEDMARFNWEHTGKEARLNIRFHIDYDALDRGCFGIFKWRLVWLKFFVTIALIPWGGAGGPNNPE